MNALTLVIDRLQDQISGVSGVWLMYAPVVDPPFITVMQITDFAQNTLDGETELRNEQLQIDVWAESFEQAYAIETDVKSALASASFTAIRIETNSRFEETSNYRRVMLTYSIWYED